jgi:hypothetical protein
MFSFKPKPLQLYNSSAIGSSTFSSYSIPDHLRPINQPTMAAAMLNTGSRHQNQNKTQTSSKFDPAQLAHPDFDELKRMSKEAITLPQGIADLNDFELPDDLDDQLTSEHSEDSATTTAAVPPHLNIVSITKKGKHVPLTEKQWKFLKDSQWRDEFLLKMGIDPKENLMKKIVHMAFLSVDPGTFRSYASHWKKLRENGCAINYGGLMMYLAKFPASIKTDSLNSWVSAVKLYMRAFGQEGHAVLLRLVTDGYAHDNPNGLAKERGIIDRGKIQQLVEHPSIVGTPYELGLQLQFATGVRGGQVDGMTCDQFSRLVDRRTQKTICF